MKNKFIALSAAVLLLIIALCSCDRRAADDAGRWSYSETDFTGTYICRGEIYDMFAENSEEYIPYFSFDGSGACTAMIYYIGGVTYVDGTYSVDDDRLSVKLDLTYSAVWDPFGVRQEDYMGDAYTFTVESEARLTIDKGFYAVHDGDGFEKISDEVRKLPDASKTEDYMGIYYCSTGAYENSSVGDAIVPYVYLAKEGHCCLYIESADGTGRELWGNYTSDGGKFHISDLRFLYDGTDADRDSIPHEYVFEIADDGALIIDRGFYNVASGDRFVREKH